MKHPGTIEFGALRIFATVADAETLTKAAERLGITQSAVSQAIKQLENQTGVELIVRRSRPIKLTQSGEVLRVYAHRMLSESRRVLNDVKLAATGGLSNLGVGMIDSFADALGLEFVTAIDPMISKISLQTGLHTSLSTALRNRDIDILITSDQSDNSPLLERHAIIRDPFLVIAPEKSLPKEDIAMEQLASSLPFIHYLPNSRIGGQTDTIARRLGIDLNTHYELDSTQTLIRFVQANYGWAIISALCLAPHTAFLDGIRLINLSNGAHARSILQLNRKNELGDMPQKIARMSRTLFTKKLVPELQTLAPWLADQAFATDQLQII